MAVETGGFDGTGEVEGAAALEAGGELPAGGGGIIRERGLEEAVVHAEEVTATDAAGAEEPFERTGAGDAGAFGELEEEGLGSLEDRESGLSGGVEEWLGGWVIARNDFSAGSRHGGV